MIDLFTLATTATVRSPSPSKSKTAPAKVTSSEKAKNEKSEVIGTTRFRFDKAILTKYVNMSIEFWRSSRELKGVDLEDTWKCNVCEYREACEWRELKALEASLRVTGLP